MMAAQNIDTSGYVDLSLFDRTAQEIYDDALAYVQWIMPQWEPAETNIENVVMQAVALMISEGQFTINRLPGAVTEVLLQLHGITRQSGTNPTVTATFTMLDDLGYTVPAGTEALYDLGDGADPIVFVLNEDVVVTPGNTSGVGTMTGNLTVSRFNAIAAGTTFSIVTPLSFLFSVVTATTVTGGSDPEDDATYFDRGSLRLARLTETLVLPRHFESYALETNTNILRAKTLDRYDPGTGPTPGDNNGHVTIAVFGNGVPVSTGEKDTLLTAIQTASLASLTFHVIDPEDINMVGVHATIAVDASADPTTVNAAVTASIADFLSPLTWSWANVIRWTNLVSRIESNDGVDYIVTLDITLNMITWDESMFYIDIANWDSTTNCTLAWDSSNKHGTVGGSLKITASANGDVKSYSSAAIATHSYVATAGNDYWVSGWVYIPQGATARTVRLGVGWYTSGNALVGSEMDTIGVNLAPGSWVYIADQMTAPATTAKARIYIEIDSTLAGEVFYLDDITLSEYQPQNADVTLVGNGPLTMLAENVVDNP